MVPRDLIELARQLASGEILPVQFEREFLQKRVDASLAATVDLDRRRRCGYPEVIFGPGKTIEQICQIAATLAHHGEPVLATRINEQQAAGLSAAFPRGRFNQVARTFRLAVESSPASSPGRR